VSADARRRQLLAVASRLLTAEGVDSVQITTVAARAGVSRPLVYRLFPTRRGLVLALLEDFAEALTDRFQRALLAVLPGTLEEITAAFIEAACQTIEERGAGPWRLLDARGADREVADLGQAILARLLSPWHARIAELTGLPPRRAVLLAQVIAAAGRAVLDAWLDGTLSRADAARDTTRAVAALLREFAEPPRRP
jgi:AcrR family transcriptional regulator